MLWRSFSLRKDGRLCQRPPLADGRPAHSSGDRRAGRSALPFFIEGRGGNMRPNSRAIGVSRSPGRVTHSLSHMWIAHGRRQPHDSLAVALAALPAVRAVCISVDVAAGALTIHGWGRRPQRPHACRGGGLSSGEVQVSHHQRRSCGGDDHEQTSGGLARHGEWETVAYYPLAEGKRAASLSAHRGGQMQVQGRPGNRRGARRPDGVGARRCGSGKEVASVLPTWMRLQPTAGTYYFADLLLGWLAPAQCLLNRPKHFLLSCFWQTTRAVESHCLGSVGPYFWRVSRF